MIRKRPSCTMASAKMWAFTLLCLCAFQASHAMNNSLNFLVIGDWGGLPIYPFRTLVEKKVAEEIGKVATMFNTSFNLGIGDNFYFDGVKNEHDKRFQETFEDIFIAKSLQNPWYFLAGNHDHYGNVSAQIAYSKLSTRWNFPNYYYDLLFEIPNSKVRVEIIMIDTILLCGNTHNDWEHDQPQGPENVQVAEDQWTYIEGKLKNSTAEYLIVSGHFPVYSIAEHGPTACLVERLLPMLIKYNVTTYFCGHDHNLQTNQTGKTMDFFVIGSSNFVDDSHAHQTDVPVGSSKFFWADHSQYGGFARIQMFPKNMTLTFSSGVGKDIYQHIMYPRKL